METKQRSMQLLSRKTIPGYIALSYPTWKPLWNWVSHLDALDFLVGKMPDIWNFLTSPIGNLVIPAFGVGLILWAILRPEKRTVQKLEQKGHEADQLETPQKYLWAVLKPIQFRDDGSKVYISVWLVSCLSHKLSYRRVSAILKYDQQAVTSKFDLGDPLQEIPKLAHWQESTIIPLTSTMPDKDEMKVTLDLSIELTEDKLLTITDIYQSQPKNGQF